LKDASNSFLSRLRFSQRLIPPTVIAVSSITPAICNSKEYSIDILKGQFQKNLVL